MKKRIRNDQGMRFSFISFLLGGLLTLFFSCGDDDVASSYTPGQQTASVYVEADQGTKTVRLKTNGSWNISLDTETSKWVKIESPVSGSGDTEVQLFHTHNPSFNRLGKVFIHVAGSEIPDTVFIKQYGKTAVLDLLTKQINNPVLGGTETIDVYTNLPLSLKDRISTELVFQGEMKNWITGLQLSSDLKKVSFEIAANQGEARQADLLLVFTDDWGERRISTCKIQQARRGGTDQTKEETFENIRKLITAASGSVTIDKDIKISGIVSSDSNNPNVAENPNLLWNSIDLQANYKTAYVQDKTGTYGFKLTMTSKDVNILNRYNKLELWLKGLTLTKESNPERYTISEITHNHFVSVSPGQKSDLPTKERYIGELTDADLYTFVKLKDCELPIRKGSYTPINEGYVSVYTNVPRVDKYPLLVRDIKGDVSYLWTNISCPYRRDGSVLPQGSGSISGIVVSESYSRFEQNGFIGKYQLRHLAKEDIAINSSASAGFSKIICEWNRLVANGTKASPTSGAGELYHSSGTALSTSYDHSYLGPITGVESEDKKGSVSAVAIMKAGWWNNNKGESWIVKFSTSGISGTQLSLQLATFCYAIGAPRYWVVETSTHGNMDGTWDKAGEYTVPDIVSWDNTLLSQLSGWKNINFSLPATLMGKDNVYVRLRVNSNKAGTASSYDGGTIVSTAANVITYLSIRYN